MTDDVSTPLALHAVPTNSDALYREILDSAVDTAVISTDRHGRILTWSVGAQQITGWTAAEMVGRPLDTIFTAEDRAAGRPAMEMRAADQSGRANDMRWHLRKDGRRFYAHGSVSPLQPPLQGYVKSFRDATVQHQTETALKEAQQRMEFTLTSAQIVGTWDWDLMNDRLSADSRFARIHSVDPQIASAGAPFTDFVQGMHPEDRDRVLAQLRHSITTGVAFESEYRLTRPDLNSHYVLARGQCVFDATGTAIRFSGVTVDVTDRRSSELALQQAMQRMNELNELLETRVLERTQELQQSQSRFQVYFEASPECLYLLRLTDADQLLFEDVNRAGAELFGLSRTDMIGRSPADVLHSECTTEARLDIELNARRALEEGRTLRYESSLNYGTRGPVTAHTIIAPLESGAGKRGVVLVCKRDMTEQRHAEEQLRQSQKMEAIGQLTAGIAHDFNNLMAGVMGSLELMQHRINQGRGDEIGRYIETAQEASRRAADVTQRLLAFSRRQTLSPQPTDVNRFVESIEGLVRTTIGSSVHLEIVAADDPWMTEVDRSQLQIALLNLCINSCEAMPNGGRLTIETANFAVDSRMAHEGDLTLGDYVSLSISDTGTGMTLEVTARAFDPFFTTKPLGTGTGLGLSMVYGFAKQSGGHVRLYSEANRGATVSMYLPRLLTKDESIRSPATAPTPEPATSVRTVLVVDDEATLRMLVLEVVGDSGYASLEAVDGASALAIIRSGAPVDLLITDVGMPNMNGRQLADQARALRPNLRVLFITGFAENAVINQGRLDPGFQIMTKPFMIDALSTKIQEMLAEKIAAPIDKY